MKTLTEIEAVQILQNYKDWKEGKHVPAVHHLDMINAVTFFISKYGRCNINDK